MLKSVQHWFDPRNETVGAHVLVVPSLEEHALAPAGAHFWWSSMSLNGLCFPVLSRLELSLRQEDPFLSMNLLGHSTLRTGSDAVSYPPWLSSSPGERSLNSLFPQQRSLTEAPFSEVHLLETETSSQQTGEVVSSGVLDPLVLYRPAVMGVQASKKGREHTALGGAS